MALGGVGRTISIALSLATQGFNAGLNSASGSLNQFARASNQSLASVATTAGAASAAMAAGLALSVRAAMDFESAMSEVEAVSGSTGTQLDALRRQALDLGADTAFSATQVANAQAELLKAGVSTADVMGGALKGALDLAAAAQIDVANAAEITSNVLNAFGLSGREASHVADVLAAAANKSAADVSDMGLAFKQTGAAATLTGMDLEETAASLSIFANAGVKGSDAGTSLKTMLLRLNPTTAEAREEMEKYGLSFVDANGEFVSLSEVAGQLERRLGGLSEAQRVATLQTIFGSDAIRAATLLYQSGAAGVTEWEGKVDDAGYAASVARIRMDNLRGDLEKLGGAIDTVLIETGSEANGVLRGTVTAATDVVNAFGSMPAAVSTASVGLGGFVTVGLAGVAALGAFIPAARNVKTSLDSMGGSWSSVAGAMSMKNMASIATGLGIVGLAVTLVSTQLEGAKRRGQEMNQVFLAGLDTPTDLAGYVAHNRAVEAEIDRLTGVLGRAYADVEGGWGNLAHGWQRFSEAISPWGTDVIYETQARLEDLTDTQHSAAASGLAYAEAVEELGERYGWSTAQVEAFAQANGIDLAGATSAAVGMLAEEKNAVEVLNGQVALTPQALENVAGVLDTELTPALDAAVSATTTAPPVVTEMSDSLKVLGDDAASAGEKMDALKSIVSDFLGLFMSEGDARDEMQRSLNGLGEAVKAAGWDFGGATNEAIAYRDLMRDITTDAGRLVEAWIDQGIRGDELRGKVAGLSTELIEQAVAMGVPRAEAEKYFGQLEQLPDDVYTNFQLPNLPTALTDVGALERALAAVERDRYVRIHVSNPGYNVGSLLTFADGGVLAFADGGHTAQIARGGPTRIWNEPETGGEAYIPLAQSKRPRSVDILRQTNALMGNPLGGAATINVTVAPSFPNYIGDKTDLARAVADPRVIDEITKGIRRSDASLVGARP